MEVKLIINMNHAERQSILMPISPAKCGRLSTPNRGPEVNDINAGNEDKIELINTINNAKKGLNLSLTIINPTIPKDKVSAIQPVN